MGKSQFSSFLPGNAGDGGWRAHLSHYLPSTGADYSLPFLMLPSPPTQGSRGGVQRPSVPVGLMRKRRLTAKIKAAGWVRAQASALLSLALSGPRVGLRGENLGGNPRCSLENTTTSWTYLT